MTQFLIKDLENLRRNGRVGNVTYKLCSLFSIHPVFELRYGRMVAKKFYKGDYQNTELRFINSIIRKMRNSEEADPERVYLIHAGCLFREMDTMHKRFEKSGNKYIIKNEGDPNKTLTAEGTINGSNVSVSSYSSGNGLQLWDITMVPVLNVPKGVLLYSASSGYIVSNQQQ